MFADRTGQRSRLPYFLSIYKAPFWRTVRVTVSQSASLVYLVNIAVQLRYRRLLHMFLWQWVTTKGQGRYYIILSNWYLNNTCESLLYCGAGGPVLQGFQMNFWLQVTIKQNMSRSPDIMWCNCMYNWYRHTKQVTFSIVFEAWYSRFLIIGQQRNIQLLSVFQYEISPVPHSLVDEFGYLL